MTKRARSDDPYRSEAALPRWRARAGSTRKVPDRLVVAWAEYQHGNLERARRVMDEVRGPASARGGAPRFRVHAFILDHLLRSREGVAAALEELDAGSGRDLDARLAAQAHHLLERGRDGLPTLERARGFAVLAARAGRAGSPLEPHLRLCLTRSLLESGALASARDQARELMGSRPLRVGVAASAAVIERVARVLSGESTGLEGLPLSGLNPMEGIQARCLLAETHLRMGHHDQAQELAFEVERSNASFRDGMIAARIRLVRATIALVTGDPDEVARQLDACDGMGAEAGPYRARSALLRARLAAANRDLAGARARLAEVSPELARRADSVGIHDAALLELELDLETRHLRPSDGDLAERYARAAASEDQTDRLRMGCRIAQCAPGAEVVDRILADAQGRSGSDPRARALAGLITAAREARAGRVKEALRIATRVEDPPRDDTPELELRLWRRLFAVDDPAAPVAALRASCPVAQRHGAALLRKLRPSAGLVRWQLVTPTREAAVDSLDLPRLERARAHLDLFVHAPAGEVHARGRKLGLDGQQRLLDLLAYLIRNPGRAIPIDELITRVWGRRVVPFETERNVFTAVSRLRKQLPERDWLETVDGGYRLRRDLSVLLLAPGGEPVP